MIQILRQLPGRKIEPNEKTLEIQTPVVAIKPLHKWNTQIIVALIGLTGTIIVALLGSPLIEKRLSPVFMPTVTVTIPPTDFSVATFTPVVTKTHVPSLTPSKAPTPIFVLSLATDYKLPKTYTLQSGMEFPYCLARRFNVDPDQLLSLSGLTSPDMYYAGLTLTIPQSGAFPGSRALRNHPATYTVLSSDEDIYGVACKHGDVFPEDIATLNRLQLNSRLSVGQVLQIP